MPGTASPAGDLVARVLTLERASDDRASVAAAGLVHAAITAAAKRRRVASRSPPPAPYGMIATWLMPVVRSRSMPALTSAGEPATAHRSTRQAGTAIAWHGAEERPGGTRCR